MLFDSGMEGLTTLIMRAVNEHLMSPLIGCTAMQRLSIYADNVDVLETYEAGFGCCSGDSGDFGNASGLQVNYGNHLRH
jgi:hypothetical protein